MSIIRTKKNKNYTTMSNYHLKDKNLSLKAKGLLSIILSLPDDWSYSVEGLVSICKENKTAVTNALKELKEHGYVSIEKIYPDHTKSKKIEYIYTIFEKPQPKKIQEKQGIEEQEIGKQDIEKQDIGFLGLENLALENQPQLNTNISNTKELNTKNKKKEYKEKTLKRFSAPKVEEVRAYCNERKNNIDPEAFIDYYQSKGWTIGKNAPMKDWKAAVRTWERKNFRTGNDYKKEKEPEHREPTDLDLEYIAAVERFNKNL